MISYSYMTALLKFVEKYSFPVKYLPIVLVYFILLAVIFTFFQPLWLLDPKSITQEEHEVSYNVTCYHRNISNFRLNWICLSLSFNSFGSLHQVFDKKKQDLPGILNLICFKSHIFFHSLYVRAQLFQGQLEPTWG